MNSTLRKKNGKEFFFVRQEKDMQKMKKAQTVAKMNKWKEKKKETDLWIDK